MTEIISRRFVVCPGCGDDRRFGVEHLFDGTERRFGPWSCRGEDCLVDISGTVHPDGTIEVESKVNPARRRGFALLKLRDLYLVRKESYGRVAPENADYFYHSHQCPTNLLRDVVEVYGPSGEHDPHGLIRYVAGVDDTPTLREAIRAPSLRDVMKLFGTDGEPIQTGWPEADGGAIPWIAEMRREEDKKS